MAKQCVCDALFRQMSFWFKILELALCITGTVIYTGYIEWHYTPNRSTVIAIAAAMPNCIISAIVLLLMVCYEVQHRVAEFCLNGTSAVLNLAMAVLMFCSLADYKSNYYLVLCILFLVLGLVLLIDIMRMLKT